MPRPLALDVEICRIRLHNLRQVRIRGLHKQVVVIDHQAERMDNGSIARMCFAEIFKKLLTILLALVDGLSLVSSGCHMVKRPGKDNP